VREREGEGERGRRSESPELSVPLGQCSSEVVVFLVDLLVRYIVSKCHTRSATNWLLPT
jgi:hypothetical protein